MAGQVVHFELPANDLDRAREFYHDAFGWTIDDAPGLPYPYLLVTTTEVDERGVPKMPGAINGGMFSRLPWTGGPTVLIDVENIERALDRILRLGGEVIRGRTPIMDMGFVAYFRDPEGNILGLWETA